MSIRKELINLTIINNSNSNFTIPLFQNGVYSINSDIKYSYDITSASLACGFGDIIINGILYNFTYSPNVSSLATALTNLGFGFFSFEIIGLNTFVYVVDNTNVYGDMNLCLLTTTTSTTTTAIPTTTTTSTTSTSTSTTSTTTTAIPTTTTTSTSSTTTAIPTTTTTSTTSTSTSTTSTSTSTSTSTTSTSTSTTSTTTTAIPTTTTTSTSTSTSTSTTSTSTSTSTTSTSTSTTSTTTTDIPTTTSTTTSTTTATPPPTTTSTTTTTTTLALEWIITVNVASDIDISGMEIGGVSVLAIIGSFPVTNSGACEGVTQAIIIPGTYTLTLTGVTGGLPSQSITVIDSNGASQNQAISNPFSGNVTFTGVYVNGVVKVQIIGNI